MAPGDSTLNAQRKDKLYGGYVVYTADQELKKKGLTVDTSEPSAIFVFESHLEEKTQYVQTPGMSVGVGYGGPGYYVGGTVPVTGGEIKATTYGEGMLVFNMYDRGTGNLVWTGGAKKSVSDSEDMEVVIKAAVKAIFYRLPVKPAKK